MLVHILNEGDFCPLVAILLILLWIGRAVADQKQQRLGMFIAIVAFVTYGGYALRAFSPGRADKLLDITLRSVGAGGITLGISWIVLPLLSALARYLIVWPLAKVRNVWRSVRDSKRIRTERRHREETLRLQQAEYDRAAPDRERARIALEERARLQVLAQKARDDTRAVCELLFHRHAHVLESRFSKEAFEDYVAKFMGDGRPADEVVQRGRQLQELILQHAHQIAPPHTPYTIESLAKWYKSTKQAVETLPLDPRSKQIQFASLNARYAELMQTLMENLQP